MASSLKHPSLSANKYIYVIDYRVSQNEILASLQKATGDKKWEVSHRTSAEARTTGFEKLGKGDFSGIADMLLGVAIYGAPKEFDYSLNHEVANEKLGLPKPEPLDVVIEKIVKGEQV